MATQLAQQLSKLQKAQKETRSLDKNATFSLLFDFKTAANFSNDTIYALAYDGFQSLLRQDPCFSRFSSRFFPVSAFKDPIIRENLTKSDNEALSQELIAFLMRLSLYFLSENAKKVMEYLIKAYEVHKYEAEELVATFLAYHHNKEFIKLVQNVNLIATDHWNFLENVVKTGEQVIPRALLVKSMENDLWLLEKIVRKDLDFWKMLKESRENREIFFSLQEKNKEKTPDLVNLQVFHRFAVALLVEFVRFSEKIRKKANYLNVLLNYAAELLRFPEFPELKLSSNMIMIAIVEEKIAINPQILAAYSKDLAEETSAVESKELTGKIFKFFVFLQQRNAWKGIPQEILQLFIKKTGFFTDFLENCQFDLQSFFRELLRKCMESRENSKGLLEVLASFLKNVQKSMVFANDSDTKTSFLQEIAAVFFEFLLEKHENHGFCCEIYREVFAKAGFSGHFNEVFCEKLNKTEKNSEKHEKMMGFLKEIAEKDGDFFENRYIETQKCSIPLKLGLISEDSEIKRQSLKQLCELLQNSEEKRELLQGNYEDLLILSMKNEKNASLFENILDILVTKENLLRLNPQSLRDLLRNLLDFCRSSCKFEAKSHKILTISAFLIAKRLENLENPHKNVVFSLFCSLYELENKGVFDENSVKALKIMHKIYPEHFKTCKNSIKQALVFENSLNYAVFLENIHKFDKNHIFIELLGAFVAETESFVDFSTVLAKYSEEIYGSIGKKQLFSAISKRILAKKPEKSVYFEILCFILNDFPAESLIYLKELGLHELDLVNLYILDAKTGKNERKNLKVLVYLNNLVRNAAFSTNPLEFFAIFLVVFIWKVNVCSLEQRKLLVNIMENIRIYLAKHWKTLKNSLISLKALDNYFYWSAGKAKNTENTVKLEDFQAKHLKKLIKIVINSRFSVIETNESVLNLMFSAKNREFFQAIYEFLNENFENFPFKEIKRNYSKMLAEKVATEPEIPNFSMILRDLEGETPDFYEIYLQFLTKSSDCNQVFARFLAFITEKKDCSHAIFSVFKKNCEFFLRLSEENQQEFLIKTLFLLKENARKYQEILTKLNIDETQLVFLMKTLFSQRDFLALEFFLTRIYTENLANIGIYKEIFGILRESLRLKLLKKQENSSFLLISLKCLTNIFANLTESLTIVYDFKGKLPAKQYEIHQKDLIGEFLQGNPQKNPQNTYENLNILHQILKKFLKARNLDNYGKSPIVAEIFHVIIELFAGFAHLSFKETAKILENSLLNLVNVEKTEHLELVNEITGFLVGKLLSKRQNVGKIKQFLVISVRTLCKLWRIHQKNPEISAVLQAKVRKLIEIYQKSNISFIILLFVREILEEPDTKVDKKARLSHFSLQISKIIEFPGLKFSDFLENLSKIFEFLNEILQESPLQSGSTLQKNDLFLLRRFFKRSQGKKNRIFLKAVLNVLNKTLKSPGFVKALEQNIQQVLLQKRDWPVFEEDFSRFFAGVALLEKNIKKNLRKSKNRVIDKKKIGISKGISKKNSRKSLKIMRILVNETSGFLKDVLPQEFFTKIAINILKRKELPLDFKALILTSFNAKLLKSKEKLQYETFKGLLQSVLAMIFEENHMKSFLKHKNLELLQISFMISIQILRKLRGNFRKDAEFLVDFEALRTFLHHEKAVIKSLAVCFISELTFFNRFLGEITEILQEIFSELNENILISEFFLEKNTHIISLVLKSLANYFENLETLLNPYFEQAILKVFPLKSNEFSNEIDKIIDILGNKIPSRNLSKPIVKIVSQENFEKISKKLYVRLNKLIEILMEKMDNDTFQEINVEFQRCFLRIFDYTKAKYIDKEKFSQENRENIDDLEKSATQAFGNFAVKCNEVQLKKYFLGLVNWSDKKLREDEVGFNFIHYRKIVIYKLMLHLGSLMGSYFVPYFNYIFEFSLSFMNEFSAIFSKEPLLKKTGKRNFEYSFEHYLLNYELNRYIIENLCNLFELDKEEFIDNQKFERLTEIIPRQFEAIYIEKYVPGYSFMDFISKHLAKLIIKLIDLVNDDYKWKSLHYSILLKTRSEEKFIRLAIVNVLTNIIEYLKDRYVVLINDLLPFLNEMLDDVDVEIEKNCKNIVLQLEKISGENIREYIKKL